MNSHLDDFKKIYKIYIRNKSIHIEEKCPTPITILNFFRLRSSKKKKMKIIDHVSNCYTCSQEFDFISEIIRAEKIFVEDINLSLNNNSIGVRKKNLASTLSIFKKPMESFFYTTSWKYLIVIIFLLSISIISIKYFNRAEKHTYRGTNLEEIALINPVEKNERKSSLMFKWNAHKAPNYYKIEIFDSSLLLIWESRKLNNTYTTLPDEVLMKLEEHNTYFWMVTAYYPDGTITESQLEKFKLIR